ncbi:hypothetical protein BMJ30_13180 [Sinorhizobium medicae]|uniref:hypothetical protein n=1 Tax=Sinorhizobium medicae TaxID=110321 RepID=UPI001304F863|nr:hypothetical protein [Sinorhizobium medicae]PLU18487.1 hypothetical protein BMJ30_13180 [Sinorhizobium medicae]
MRPDNGRETDIDRIEMRDEPDPWRVGPGATLHTGHNRLLVEHDVLDPEHPQLLGQQGGKLALAGGGGQGRRVTVTLALNGHVPEKPADQLVARSH